MKYLPFMIILASCSFLQNHPLLEDSIEEVVEDIVKIETGIDLEPYIRQVMEKNSIVNFEKK